MSTPPSTPPTKSRWGRMGGVMRRASTIMAISRPGTPSERDSDTASLRRSTSRELIPPSVPALSPPPPPKTAAEIGVPTPIAESPAREAEASQQRDTVVGPSPLSQPSASAQPQEEVLTTSPEPVQPAVAPAVDPAEQVSSPTGYIPPPVIDSTVGNPGAFTDDPESLPQPDVVPDPYLNTAPSIPAPAEVPDAQTTDIPDTQQSQEPPVVDSSAGNPGAFSDLADDLPKPVAVIEDPFNSTPNPVSAPEPPAIPTPEEPAAETEPAPKEDVAFVPVPVVQPASEPVPASVQKEEELTSYFDKPIVESIVDFDAVSPEVPLAAAAVLPVVAEASTAAEDAGPFIEAQPSTEPEPEAPPLPLGDIPAKTETEGEATSYLRGDVGMPVPETHMNDARPMEDAPSSTQPAPAPETQPQPEPQPQPSFDAAVMPPYRHDLDLSMGLPSYSGHDIWGGAISTNTGAANTATAAQYKQDSTNSDKKADDANTSQPPAGPGPEPPHGEHNVWATGTMVAGAAAAAAVAAIGGMAYIASQNGGQDKQQGEGRKEVTMPVPNPGGGSIAEDDLSRASSVRMPLPNPHPEPSAEVHEDAPYPDPFADPVPSIAVQQPGASQPGPQMPEPVHEEPQPIVVPLPPFREVIPTSSIHNAPSQSTTYSAGNGDVNLQTDERIPLLVRPATPGKHSRHGHNNPYMKAPGGKDHASVSPLFASGSASAWNPNSHHPSHRAHGAHQLRLHELGWLEYHLPDGTVYYVHPTRKVTTDVNLRKDVVLDALEAWLDERTGPDGESSVNVGVEAWVKGVSSGKGGKKVSNGRNGKGDFFVFERYWVDHIARTVVKEDVDAERRIGGYGRGNGYSYQYGHTPSSSKGKKQASGSAGTSGRKFEEDQLDLEYRFWSFMEAYPAHSNPPAQAKSEAMDALTWAWTDRLLPSNRPIPSPFSQEECQELMALLRSFNEHRQDDYGIQTRVIARILLRVAEWRQTYFRPNKPLPKDVGFGPANRLPAHRRPLSRAFLDFFVSILLLGIPYLFLERARLAGRVDQESGLLRSASPMVIIGACTCLVAAIVLSASVTFLSLPGLDSVARTAGMVAVLFAAFTMVATGVAVLRHKTDLERRVPHIGVEGLMVISRRTVALSFPLVFLAYSIIAFVTGIVLYSYRGVSSNPPLPKHAFEDYMRWTVVGVVGGLVGVVTTSLLLFRR